MKKTAIFRKYVSGKLTEARVTETPIDVLIYSICTLWGATDIRETPTGYEGSVYKNRQAKAAGFPAYSFTLDRITA